MTEYKLKYTSKEEADADLIAKGVIVTTEDGISYANYGVHGIVYVGLIPDTYGTYDEEGNEITPETYIEGYHVDVYTDQDIDFGDKRVNPTPSTPYHTLA